MVIQQSFGFVKKSEFINHSRKDYSITLLDGIQNIFHKVSVAIYKATTSNLVDAYKRSELHTESGLGIFALSAIIVDKAEPSEALKANIAWSLGLENPTYLVSSKQLSLFQKRTKNYTRNRYKRRKRSLFCFN